MIKLILAAAALAWGLGLGAMAFASPRDDHQEESALLAAAKITLGEAVSRAEALHDGGRAVDADLDRHKDGKPVWDITVVTADKMFDVVLDAGTDAVISDAEDRD